MNNQISEEQQIIINSCTNTIVDAVAGSGKTTTIINMAKTYITKNMLMLTYNSMLRHEVKQKVKDNEITNLIIHTYHSMAVSCYDKDAFTDEKIKYILEKDLENNNKNVYDYIIIDEAQDLIHEYILFVKKIIKDTNSNPIMFMFGDRMQSIYEFKGSDSRFLTLGDHLWNDVKLVNSNIWEKETMNTTYRLTNSITSFVNKCMMKNDRIISDREGEKVDYYICDPWTIYERIGNYIVDMIKNKNMKEKDIFILVPSMKNTYYLKLENYLVSNNLKCFSSISDEAILNSKLIEDKIVFTTFHQSKGRERPIVIIYNFDNSYFKYYLKDVNQYVCPSILYVAVTRASKKLILIHDYKCEKLSFIDIGKHHSEYLNMIDDKNIHCKNIDKILSVEHVQQHSTSVTMLIKFIKSEIMTKIDKLIEGLFIPYNCEKPKKIINTQTKIIGKNKSSVEEVSELNGIVIPAIYEKKTKELSTIEKYVKNNIDRAENVNIKMYAKKYNIPCKSIADYLKIGNIYSAITNGLHSKLAQISSYSWLTQSQINCCMNNLSSLDDKVLIYEKHISNNSQNVYRHIHDKYNIINISGIVDATNDEYVYEFKYVDSITITHKLQLLLYYWMLKKIASKKTKYILFNIKNGEELLLKKKTLINKNKINEIVELLFINKFEKKIVITDEEFITLYK